MINFLKNVDEICDYHYYGQDYCFCFFRLDDFSILGVFFTNIRTGNVLLHYHIYTAIKIFPNFLNKDLSYPDELFKICNMERPNCEYIIASNKDKFFNLAPNRLKLLLLNNMDIFQND